ncbi:hypothetical protein CR513_39455, partial [Mucuna pruriens]
MSQNQSNINLQGLDTTSNIPRSTYQQELEDDQKSIQSPTYSSIHEPYDTDIIGDPSTNVITIWQIKDDELIQYELPPTIQYQLPKVKDNNDKLVVGESIDKEKISTKFKDNETKPSHVQIEKPLFKPFKVSEKAKQKFRELRKQKPAKEEVGDNNSELLTKTNSLLKTILETPQTSKDSHKIEQDKLLSL